MISIDLQGRRYNIEFRHLAKGGKRPRLRKVPVNAITICTIAVQRVLIKTPRRGVSGGDVEFTAIDAAICTAADNFSRARGRSEALRKALEVCGAFDNQTRKELWARYHGIEPCPTCAGQGWMMGEGHDGEACPDCQNGAVSGGTGWKGGALLSVPAVGLGKPVRLLLPNIARHQRKPKAERSEADIAALKAAGAGKRERRRLARGGSA